MIGGAISTIAIIVVQWVEEAWRGGPGSMSYSHPVPLVAANLLMISADNGHGASDSWDICGVRLDRNGSASRP